MEESFNMQAMYDLLYKSWGDISSFDHIEFPGVVPRTFIIPILISMISIVPKMIGNFSAFLMLHIVRAVLGSMVVYSLLRVRLSISSGFTELAGSLFSALVVCQFHLLFYASRTLPNVFALVLTNLALATRIGPPAQQRPYRSTILLCIACALLRSELSLYTLMLLITDAISSRVSAVRTIRIGLITGICVGVVSIVVDSYFWKRLTYPELEVFYFNVVLNKSSAWGRHPFLWYFHNALPRALGGALVIALWSMVSHWKEVGIFATPAFLFVGLYSILPHKELRFIFYVLPVMNAAAAIGLDAELLRMYGNASTYAAKKNDDYSRPVRTNGVVLRGIVFAGLALLTFSSSIMQTVISSTVSQKNYPSGNAMRRMHEIDGILYTKTLCTSGRSRIARVHIDVDSAMNGVSQFVQLSDENKGSCPTWMYSKRENVENIVWGEYTHLISTERNVLGFCVIHTERIFAGVDWRQASLISVPHTFVHRNKNISTVGCKDL